MAVVSSVRIELLARVEDSEPVEVAVIDAPVTMTLQGHEAVVSLDQDVFFGRLRAVVEAMGSALEESV